MTDMTSAKKRVIRSRARRFAMDLNDASLDSGLGLYQSTIDDLYEGKSRIRICLKCGAIESSNNLNASNHSCALDFRSFQVVVSTNWNNLEAFFLTEKYVKALQSIGVELDQREIVTVPVENKEEIKISASQKEKADTSVSQK